MGTSKKYDAPTGGNWPTLKTLVTAFGDDPGEPVAEPPPLLEDPVKPAQSFVPITLPAYPERLSSANILRQYLAAHSSGGTSVAPGGGGGGGGTRNSVIGRQARRTATNLARFAAQVNQAGLAEALREINLGDFVGRPAAEVLHAIVGTLAGPGSTMEEALAARALNEMRTELLASTETFDDVEAQLQQLVASAGIDALLMDFYSHYLFAKFNRDFYESLRKRYGAQGARDTLEQVRRTLFAAVRTRITARQPLNGDWSSREGAKMAETIMNQVLSIFEVTL